MLEEYVSHITNKLRPRTLIFLIQGSKVLLGYKKTGFGKGYYIGIGGKVESSETIKEGAIRELEEEIHVRVALKDLNKAAIVKFYFPHITDERWNQAVHVYVVTKWEGEPRETDEIYPTWFETDVLPFDNMWDDARYWIPEILNNKKIYEEYLFDKNLKVTEHRKLV